MNSLDINITKADVSAYLNRVASLLNSKLDESKVPIPSVLVKCIDSTGEMTLVFGITADMEDAKKRNEVFNYIGKNIADDRSLPLITCFVTSAWMLQEKHQQHPGLPLLHNQNQNEAIVIFALSLNRISLISHAEVNEKRIDGFCEVFESDIYPLNEIYHGYLDRLDEVTGKV